MSLVATHPSLRTPDCAARSILERGEMNGLVLHLAGIRSSFTVLDELRKQIIHAEICIHLHLFWHEMKPSLASKAHSCRHHDVRPELGSLHQEASWINITFSAS